MDSSGYIMIQYVGGMANVRTCDESLYHGIIRREQVRIYSE